MATVLVLNPGSTSTKMAVFADKKVLVSETIRHPAGDMARFNSLWQQYPYRLGICLSWAKEHLKACDAVGTLGGLLRPLEGGIYHINDRLLADARANLQGEHASNLGCALANEIAGNFRARAFAVDPVSVDEFEPIAYISGHPEIKRRSLAHALNIHATARRAAAEHAIPYGNSSFIIAHLGGGISVAPVRGGRIIDVNDASSDGPFTPERTGGLPLQPFISLCFSGKYSEKELRSLVMGKGGLVAYLGTNSVEEVEKRIKSGDEAAREVLQAMVYQIAKEIGAMATVLSGRVDAIILTGGTVHSAMLVDLIEERVRFIAPVVKYPGEQEMLAIAEAVLRALSGEEQIKEY